MSKIRDFIDCVHLPIQCAVSATNSTYKAYLTDSGKVCRQEYGFVEDLLDTDPKPTTLDLGKITWSSIVRLNRCLANIS
jgi:hypothetical protein